MYLNKGFSIQVNSSRAELHNRCVSLCNCCCCCCNKNQWLSDGMFAVYTYVCIGEYSLAVRISSMSVYWLVLVVANEPYIFLCIAFWLHFLCRRSIYKNFFRSVPSFSHSPLFHEQTRRRSTRKRRSTAKRTDWRRKFYVFTWFFCTIIIAVFPLYFPPHPFKFGFYCFFITSKLLFLFFIIFIFFSCLFCL